MLSRLVVLVLVSVRCFCLLTRGTRLIDVQSMQMTRSGPVCRRRQCIITVRVPLSTLFITARQRVGHLVKPIVSI